MAKTDTIETAKVNQKKQSKTEQAFGPKLTFIWEDNKKVTRETYEKDTNVREE